MQEITTQDEWNDFEQSASTYFIFKHSTTCPISAHALMRVNGYLSDRILDEPPFVLVKVIEARPLSNAIASALDVQHQSPQLILVWDGKAQWDASHHWITAESIEEAVEALG